MITNVAFVEEVEGKKSYSVKVHRDALISLKALVRPTQGGVVPYGLSMKNNGKVILSAPLDKRLSLLSFNPIKVRKGEVVVEVETEEKKTVYVEITVREI